MKTYLHRSQLLCIPVVVIMLATTAYCQQWSYSGNSLCLTFNPQVTTCSSVGSIQGYATSAPSNDAQHAEAMRENYETAQTIGQNAGNLISGLFGMWAQHRAQVKAERESLQNEYKTFAEAAYSLQDEYIDLNKQIMDSSIHLAALDKEHASVWLNMSTGTSEFLLKAIELHASHRRMIDKFSASHDKALLKHEIKGERENYEITYKYTAKEYVISQLLHGLEIYYQSHDHTP